MNKLVSHCCHAPVMIKLLKGMKSDFNWYICSSCYAPCDAIPVSPPDNLKYKEENKFTPSGNNQIH